MIAQVRRAVAAEIALAAIDSGIKGDTIPPLPACHIGPDLVDHPGSLVPHDHWRDAPSGAAIHAVYIASTDTTGFHPDLHIVWPDNWLRHIFVHKVIVLFQYQCFHGQCLLDPGLRRTGFQTAIGEGDLDFLRLHSIAIMS